ncbi:MAG: DUF1587 domain-containing protein [Pirellulales bacterium]
MNRVEYENTVRDLLGIETALTEMLPEDSATQGFDNVGDGLSLSPILMERYLEAANAAYDGVFRRIKPLPAATRRVTLLDNKENIDSVAKKKGGVLASEGAFVKFTGGWPPARIDESHPIEAGDYRGRIAVWPYEPGERTLAAAVFVGPLFGPGKRRFVGMFDVTGTADDPRIIEFVTHMDEGDAMQVVPWIYPRTRTKRPVLSPASRSPGRKHTAPWIRSGLHRRNASCWARIKKSSTANRSTCGIAKG